MPLGPAVRKTSDEQSTSHGGECMGGVAKRSRHIYR